MPSTRGPGEDERNRRFIHANMRFRREVFRATGWLIYALNGINLFHRRTPPGLGSGWPGVDYPLLRVWPQVAGDQSFHERSAPGGPMEQFLYRAWVIEVYHHIWEHESRPELREAFEPSERKIPMETNPLGDFKRIRDDLVHHGRVAERCGRCKTLRWFKPNERMELGMRHVLDFFNQMGWCDSNSYMVDNSVVMWVPRPEDLGPSQTSPTLVSVRPVILEPGEAGFRLGAGIVFEDGHFAQALFDEVGISISDDDWRNMEINDNGDLWIPPGHIVSAKTLYAHCFVRKRPGPGPASPAFRIG